MDYTCAEQLHRICGLTLLAWFAGQKKRRCGRGATPTVSWGEDNRPERGEGRLCEGDYSRMMRKAAVLPAEVVAVSR